MDLFVLIVILVLNVFTLYLVHHPVILVTLFSAAYAVLAVGLWYRIVVFLDPSLVG